MLEPGESVPGRAELAGLRDGRSAADPDGRGAHAARAGRRDVRARATPPRRTARPRPDAPASCAGATGDCFAFSVSNPAPRPAAHWDASFHETVNGTAARTWTLHVGKSFADVPADHPFYAAIETLFHSGVTAGCGPGIDCPDAGPSRAPRWRSFF